MLPKCGCHDTLVTPLIHALIKALKLLNDMERLSEFIGVYNQVTLAFNMMVGLIADCWLVFFSVFFWITVGMLWVVVDGYGKL